MVASLTYFTIAALIALASAQTSFDPGCSFFNGQCVYNVKLGHANQCDSSTGKRDTAVPTSGNVTGFQSCSCKDIDAVNGDVKTLWTNIQTLQSNFDVLAKSLNVSQEQLSVKVVDLDALHKNNTRLSALLSDREYLLNKSQVALADTVSDMNAELERLRIELTATNNKLTVCQTRLGMVDGQQSKSPALYGNFVTHICDFESISMCNYTVTTSSSSEKWHRGTGRQNTVSGPVEDHTFGAPSGHYMYIDPYDRPLYVSSSSHSAPSRTATMTSPEYPPANNYCIRFWYTMFGADIGAVNVYAQVGGGNGYPIFTHSGQIDRYWHMVEVPLDSEYTSFPFKVVFTGSTDSYSQYSSSSSSHKIVHDEYGYIAIDDVYVYNTTCKSIPECPAGGRKMTHNNHTACYTFHLSPMSWSDAVTECKKASPSGHLVSVNTKFEHDFLVDTIANDVAYNTAGASGWYTSGNDERQENHFVWTDSGFPTDLNFTNWRAGQPNNVGDIQNCLLLQYAATRYEWGDVNCADKHPFICEIPL